MRFAGCPAQLADALSCTLFCPLVGGQKQLRLLSASGLAVAEFGANSTTWPWWPGGSGKGALAIGRGHHLGQGWRKRREIKNGASTTFTIGRQRAAGAVTGKAGSGRAVRLPGQLHACGPPTLSMGHGFGGESHHSRKTSHEFRVHCSTCDRGEGRAIAHSPRPGAFGYK